MHEQQSRILRVSFKEPDWVPEKSKFSETGRLQAVLSFQDLEIAAEFINLGRQTEIPAHRTTPARLAVEHTTTTGSRGELTASLRESTDYQDAFDMTLFRLGHHSLTAIDSFRDFVNDTAAKADPLFFQLSTAKIQV